MNAILLAAGFGTRLRPMTNAIPKCLVPIKGKPLLQIWLERLTAAEIGSFLINTHYLPEQVEQFISASPLKNKATLFHEPVLLGTAGTLIANKRFFQEEDGMLIHADNYCLADLQAFIKAHKRRPKECLMTMMTFKTDSPSECGIVELNREGIVVGFYEKVECPPSNLANGAVYILSHQMLSILISNFSQVSDFSTEVLPHFAGKIYTYETKEIFMDIGTPEKYKMANKLL